LADADQHALCVRGGAPSEMIRRMIRLAQQLTLSWIANAVVLAIVTGALSGVTADNAGALIWAALLFGILNTVLKPILRLLTLPLAFITLGLIWFGVAMLMLWLTALLVDGFAIHGFRTYVWATVIVWAVNVVLDFVPGPWRGTRRD
jgi:putative membrane protein